MKKALITFSIPVGLVALAALIGAFLPRQHTAIRSALFHEAAAPLYSVAHDFAAMPSWREGLQSVRILPPRDGRVCFQEVSGHQDVTYVVEEDQPPVKLVTRLDEDGVPFGGTWTYEFLREPAGTRVRITEHGEIDNVLFRFLARFVFGYTGKMDNYLRDLGRKFGETVVPGS